MDHPAVTIILPVFNEIDTIDETVSSLLDQDYSGALDIIVADGGSTDGTIERLERLSANDPRLVLIHNDRQRQSFGLNAAAAASSSSLLVRADGHTRYAEDYVSRSVEIVLDTGAAAGGRMNPVGSNHFGRAVAAAMNSPLTMGPARFHHADRREEVDTVYLGAFPRDDFLEIGGFRAFPSGAAEDADFYHRWRKTGRKVVVDPVIHTEYTPRDNARSLWSQYYRYGLGKAEMLWVNGRFPSWRPLAPAVLVVGLVAAALIGLLAEVWWPLVAALGAWLAVVGLVAVRSGESIPRVVAAAMIMHAAYGIGVLQGVVRGPWAVKHLR
jgi:glycosyltransferase involved in cell wall biosynthesis